MLPPIVLEPLPQDDPKRRCPDITKAKRILKWEPKVGLEEGLRLTLDYFKQGFAARSLPNDEQTSHSYFRNQRIARSATRVGPG